MNDAERDPEPCDQHLELDDYEASNLLWLLRLAGRMNLDTGDWCHQIPGFHVHDGGRT